MKNNRKIKNKLVKFVKQAYKQIKNIKNEISTKGTKDLLTTSDLAVEKFLIKKLNNFMPDTPIISEEFNFDKKKTKEYFTIDPIDGTINFANGLDIWAIQVAYINHFEEQVSVIYFPMLNKLYTAIKDKGAFCNGKKIAVSKIDIEDTIVAKDFSTIETQKSNLLKDIQKKVMRVRNFGAACYGFSMVASGSVGGYIFYHNNAWDIAPGYLLCKEAGAFSERNDSYTVVASSNELLELIVNAINKNK